ncbi:cation:proton antiporter [Rubrivirga sp. IMCC43871]|uniref:cation:proton antiporter domain-containing protein n=1 Tax=Rubrivirga sp. IMCC43871 TaxID=3391575 RepID=UPI00398FDE15
MDLPVPQLPVTDPVLIVAITMGILLAGPLLFERFRVPGLVGLIALGAIAGPSVTGLLERDATFVLLGTFGLLYLMFMAGVTLDLAEFAKQRTQALAFGALSFAVPMALALTLAPSVLGYGMPAAALLGSIVGSHTLLALPIAGRLGISKNRALVIATGATLVTDLFSLLVLAVVQGVASGEADAEFWMLFVVKDIVWAAAVLWLMPKAARAFFRRVRREDDAAFAFLLALVFFAAWTASLAGLAPIIGAFLAGIALNPLIPKSSPLMTRLQFVGNAFLVPFFLVSVGLLVDVGVLGSPTVWGLALLFSAIVFVGKGGAAMLGIPFFGFTRDEALTVAGLTMPQAAATLAVTLIGFDIGLFSQTAVNAVVVVIVLTCLVGPSLVQAVGRRVALAEADRPYEPASAPERIVVPLSNPETAADLMELALLLRSPQSEEPVFPVAVARAGADEAENVAAAERLMERAVLHATAASVPVSPTVRIDDNAVRGILRAGREVRASEVVAGWNGQRSPGAMVFGHVIDGVLAESRAMVVVARLVAPLAAARRLVVLVPPLVHRETGFARAARVLKVLAAQKGLRVVAFAASDDASEVERRLTEARPEASVEVRPLDEWSGAVRALDDEVSTGDVLVLIGVRHGAVAWRPALTRLPRVLARRHPGLDLLSMTLSEAAIVPLVAEAVDGDGVEDLSLPPEHIVLDLSPASAEAMLRRLLTPGFPDHPGVAAKLATRLAAMPDDAPEVMPGVVFYHAHVPEVEAPQVHVGVCPRGAPLPHTGQPARVVVVLLAPDAMDAEAYLRQLAVTAQLIRSESTVERLVAAESPEAARDALFGAVRDDLAMEPADLPATS